ncbi:hypothetical protein B0J11DRAFT_575469 [Dendryphion nanum]|uniref:Uncharacterized protein n=1 Tax=Dendryphion nanum TaxID=256645 RepID=A0A9P9IZG0_9PLEO|nr:hypothetical protein B0J11DRAFT_575469 [Dendryphion nanum]
MPFLDKFTGKASESIVVPASGEYAFDMKQYIIETLLKVETERRKHDIQLADEALSHDMNTLRVVQCIEQLKANAVAGLARCRIAAKDLGFNIKVNDEDEGLRDRQKKEEVCDNNNADHNKSTFDDKFPNSYVPAHVLARIAHKQVVDQHLRQIRAKRKRRERAKRRAAQYQDQAFSTIQEKYRKGTHWASIRDDTFGDVGTISGDEQEAELERQYLGSTYVSPAPRGAFEEAAEEERIKIVTEQEHLEEMEQAENELLISSWEYERSDEDDGFSDTESQESEDVPLQETRYHKPGMIVTMLRQLGII